MRLKLVDNRIHHMRMKSMRRVDSHCRDAFILQLTLHFIDALFRTRDDAHIGRIDCSNLQIRG